MALIEILTIELGSSIAKSILKRWLGDSGPISDTASGIVDILKTRTTDRLALRRAERQFETIGEKVGENLMPIFEVEGAILSENERRAVALAVAETQNAATSEVIAQRNFEPAEIAKQLLLLHPARLYIFSELEGHLYERIIEESCEYIVDIAAQLPHFTERTLAEILKREGQLITIAEKILQEVSRMRAELDPKIEAARFELDYRRAVIRHLDELELFGSGMSMTGRKYSLSLAYVTLSLEQEEHHIHPSKARNTDVSPFETETSTETVRRITTVNEILSDAHAILIRGNAGSGKTTLLQWIAVQSASQAFPQSLQAWNATIPFYIRLRQHVPLDSSTPPIWPAPEVFPGLITPAIAGAMPHGWVHQQLKSERAIVLVDGVDEVPSIYRESMHEWLKELMVTYSQARFVVTSRPYAIDDKELRAAGFKDASLLPMELLEIETFIDQWHAAMMANAQEGEEQAQLLSAAKHLKEEVRRDRSKRLLATNPILCAMLCALNRERHQKLPSDRIELYEACCELLIERRDEERHIPLSQYPAAVLSYTQKSFLLADLAYWFVRNGWTEAALESVEERFDGRLIRIPGIQQKIVGADARKFFVERSGMIREPVKGAIDFAHRTFQEFLAAKAILDEGDIGVLVKHAHDYQWHEIILLAAGQATTKVRGDLIEQLIGRGETEKAYRSQLYLLAAACAQVSREEVELNTKLRIERRLKALVPIKSVQEVEALAAAGELALPYLSPRLHYTPATAAACIRVLIRIGSEAAMKVLAAYVNDHTLPVVNALFEGLQDADNKEVYAQRFLQHIKNLQLLPQTTLEHLIYLPQITSLKLGYLPDGSDLSVLGQLPQLTSLRLRYLPKGSDLSVLGQLPQLTSLELWNLPDESDSNVLRQLPQLTSLRLRYLPEGSDLSVLGQLPQLTSLELGNLPEGSDLSVPAHITYLMRV